MMGSNEPSSSGSYNAIWAACGLSIVIQADMAKRSRFVQDTGMTSGDSPGFAGFQNRLRDVAFGRRCVLAFCSFII
jgi:hypothetical protein